MKLYLGFCYTSTCSEFGSMQQSKQNLNIEHHFIHYKHYIKQKQENSSTNTYIKSHYSYLAIELLFYSPILQLVYFLQLLKHFNRGLYTRAHDHTHTCTPNCYYIPHNCYLHYSVFLLHLHLHILISPPLHRLEPPPVAQEVLQKVCFTYQQQYRALPQQTQAPQQRLSSANTTTISFYKQMMPSQTFSIF